MKGLTHLSIFRTFSFLSFPRRRESRPLFDNLGSRFHGNDTKHVSSIYAGLAVAVSIVFIPCIAGASTVVLENKVVTVEAGKTFTVPIAIDPGSEKHYTARFTLAFSPDLLEVVSFAFEPNWLPVPQPGYDVINNTNGELRKTAGFPGGFSSRVPFGTVTFRAKNIGKDKVSVGPRSFILNAASKNTLDGRPQVAVTIYGEPVESVTKTKETVQPEEPLPNLPQGETNLFDINLAPQIETTGAGLASRVAPGELLPLSVKLLNFGNRKKVDVTISYKITDGRGTIIYHAKETVAVETTATFVKTIQIPFEALPGRYIAESSIVYQGQVAPAVTDFPFTVERKILGLFSSDFYRYSLIIILLSVLLAALGRFFVKRRATRFEPFDYSDIPHNERVFFELLSDTIMEMRQRVGDKALDIARQIDGLVIDVKTGRVLKLTGKPSKIIAELVSGYENTLGKKVSFSLRPEKVDLNSPFPKGSG